jgi:hypothetical protein
MSKPRSLLSSFSLPLHPIPQRQHKQEDEEVVPSEEQLKDELTDFRAKMEAEDQAIESLKQKVRM